MTTIELSNRHQKVIRLSSVNGQLSGSYYAVISHCYQPLVDTWGFYLGILDQGLRGISMCMPTLIFQQSRLIRISLVRISLLQFFKTFHKYLPYVNFGLFYLISATFWAKIAKNLH